MQALASLLASAHLGAPTALDAITYIPMFSRQNGVDADLLEEAIARGNTQVEEVNESGSVNVIRVTHHGDRSLLLLDGEQILGAKQNRIFNASYLIPAGSAVGVPVSCVEQRRWRKTSSTFHHSGTTLTGAARAAKVRRMTLGSLGGSPTHDANQREVWKDVEGYLERTSTTSGTAALHDAYLAQKGRVEAAERHIAPEPNQIGAAFVRGDTLLSLDVMGSAALWSRAHRKLVRGTLAEVYSPAAATKPPEEVVRSAISQIGALPFRTSASPGAGDLVQGAAGTLSASVLTYEGKVYHAVIVT